MDKNIEGLKTFECKAFEDFRGDIYTTWDKEKHPQLNWRLDKFSHSKKNVLRGVHGDTNTWKLINCVYGEFYLIVADNRKDSPTYKNWTWFVLSPKNRLQVLVPPGVGNGHFVLSDECTFHYKLAFDGNYNDVENQFVIKWNDPEWGFEWPHDMPILYGRDK